MLQIYDYNVNLRKRFMFERVFLHLVGLLFGKSSRAALHVIRKLCPSHLFYLDYTIFSPNKGNHRLIDGGQMYHLPPHEHRN